MSWLPPATKDTRIADLQQQLEAECKARRRAEHIIAALTERISELEALPQTSAEVTQTTESESREEHVQEHTEAQGAES